MSQILISSLTVGCVLSSLALIGMFIYQEKFKSAFVSILLLSLFLKLYCSADQYLHEWDERYHALVAKNLIDQPFRPALYENPVEPYDHTNWVGNHVWLSKPPLPLWLMAGSIAAFGTHEYAVRFPGVLFALLSVLVVYKMTQRLFGERAALIAALLQGTHGMLTDLASGRLSSDGVETAFLFFVNLGMYWIFRKPAKTFLWKDYLIVGLITGLALMCKWQPAFIILIVAFVYHFQWKNIYRHIGFMGLSLITSLFVLLPWAWHCWVHFPNETQWMIRALFHPLIMEIHGNDATWYSYFTDFGNFFGYPTFILLAIITWKFWKDKSQLSAQRQKMLALSIWILVPFVVFNLAEIKRGTYLMIFSSAVFILLAYFITEGYKKYRQVYVLRALTAASLLTIAIYSIEKLYLFSPNKSRTKDWSERIKHEKLPEGAVIYNEPRAIELMFYQDVTAYTFDNAHLKSENMESPFSKSSALLIK